VTERKRLDITKLKTIEDLNNTPWEDYLGDEYTQWVKYIVYPVAQSELDRVSEMSFEEGCNVKITWNMGELYFSRLKTFEA
jgi:hypothetical protein